MSLTTADLEKIVQLTIETYRHEKEKARNERENQKYRNTRLLLEKYKAFKVHCLESVTELIVDDDYEIRELMALLTNTEDSFDASVKSVLESVAKTRALVRHIDHMLEYFKDECYGSPRIEMRRRYEVIESLYLLPKTKTPVEIAEEMYVDVSTVSRYKKAAIQELSALIFGCL